MLNLTQLILDFWKYVIDNGIELYNEFSLQHELGIFLRENIEGYKVQFERNVSYFDIPRGETAKKEVDIVIFDDSISERYAIELKYPRNGQYPEQMYAFVKDILFAEELKNYEFTAACAVTLVEDAPFYSGVKQNGIYQYFRTGTPINGVIYRPTGDNKNDEHITVAGTYLIEWQSLDDKRKYYIVTI